MATSLLGCVLLSGCGMSGNGGGTDSAGTPPLGTAVQGRVMGGQQPVSGATIQLYAVSQTGAKTAAMALITTGTPLPVVTDANGNFNITGRYTCPTGAYVYLTATGGNPGLMGTVNNPKLALMTGLGACSTLVMNYPFLQINELTTAATVYALAGFMADTTHVGVSAANTQGLANAFATIANLVNIPSGSAPGAALPTTSTAPTAELNTLANVIANCVNSDGTGTPCANLITATTVGASVPVDTVTAMLNIAHNPTNNVVGVFSQAAAQAPFQPSLGGAPADWTVAVKATGGGLSAPSSLAIDAAGSVWVANSSGTTVTKLTNAQGLASGAGGYAATGLLGPQGVAIDTNGNAWVASVYGNSVIELNTTGTAVSPAGGYTSAGISSPVSVAIDTNNNVWVANFNGNSVSGLNASMATATVISGSPFTAGGTMLRPAGVAIDPSSNVWVTNSGETTVAELSSAGATLSGAGYNDGVVQEPVGVALDATGRAYVAGNGGNTLDVFSSGGASVSAVTSSLSLPSGVATDAANVEYTTNGVAAGSLTIVSVAGSSQAAVGSLNAPLGVAVDESGNVWTANSGDNSVSEFVGLGTPTRTPLAYAFSAF
jgi:sugar lactone lactonase YvrE